MACGYRTTNGESHSIAASGANANPGAPTGSAQGDVWVGMLVAASTSTTAALPTGWTTLYSGTVTSNFKFAVGWVAWTGTTAPATAFSNSSVYREAYILAFSGGCDQAALDSQSASGTTATSGITSPNPPATVAVAPQVAITGAVNWGGSSGGWVAPTGYTMRSNNATGNDGALATKVLAVAGTEDPSAFTGASGANAGWNGFTITLDNAAVVAETLGFNKRHKFDQLEGIC